MQTGNTMEYVKREYFKRSCNPELFVRTAYDKLAKRDVERLRSSRDLDTGEMTTAIERFPATGRPQRPASTSLRPTTCNG